MRKITHPTTTCQGHPCMYSGLAVFAALCCISRRDVAALFLEVCLYVMRLLSSVGILRLGPDTTGAYHRDGWMALAVIWAGVMLHRSGCNQVRWCELDSLSVVTHKTSVVQAPCTPRSRVAQL